MSSSRDSSGRTILAIVAGVFWNGTYSCSLEAGNWSERSIRSLLSLWVLLLVDSVLCREDTTFFVLLLMLRRSGSIYDEDLTDSPSVLLVALDAVSIIDLSASRSDRRFDVFMIDVVAFDYEKMRKKRYYLFVYC